MSHQDANSRKFQLHAEAELQMLPLDFQFLRNSFTTLSQCSGMTLENLPICGNYSRACSVWNGSRIMKKKNASFPINAWILILFLTFLAFSVKAEEMTSSFRYAATFIRGRESVASARTLEGRYAKAADLQNANDLGIQSGMKLFLALPGDDSRTERALRRILRVSKKRGISVGHACRWPSLGDPRRLP
jgi:hypothetical protein